MRKMCLNKKRFFAETGFNDFDNIPSTSTHSKIQTKKPNKKKHIKHTDYTKFIIICVKYVYIYYVLPLIFFVLC